MSTYICIHECMQNINMLHKMYNIKLAKLNGKVCIKIIGINYK